MEESKCEKCGEVHAWSNLVLRIMYKCQRCNHLNEYSRRDKAFIHNYEADEYAKFCLEQLNRGKEDKIREDEVTGKREVLQKAIEKMEDFKHNFTATLGGQRGGKTEIMRLATLQHKQQEYHERTNYKFNTSCEEAVDVYRIAEDLDEQTYCLHVVTENTTVPNLNLILVHRSVTHKANVLEFDFPAGIETEVYENFTVFYLNSNDNIEVPKKLDYSDYKEVMKWIKEVRCSEWDFPKKVNGKPISVKVTNCSVGR